MIMREQDPDVVRWGLHLLDVCRISSGGSPCSTMHYDEDLSRVGYVNEGYCVNQVENDEMIARAYQEELSRAAAREASGTSRAAGEAQQTSNFSQDWLESSRRHTCSEHSNNRIDIDERETFNSFSNIEDRSLGTAGQSYSPEIEDESILDGEVGKRLDVMVPIRHVPKINGNIPTAEEEVSDHQRLLERLRVYDLVELKVKGDGNCQFRSLSDQIYRSTEHHEIVRGQVVNQLRLHPEFYQAYVPMAYDDYLKHISKSGEWGDHVTLQAAADAYGVKIFIITSFRDTCYIEILPQKPKSKRIIFLSFWAEVHYNSIYPEGDFPEHETKKKKKWWVL